MERVVVYVDGFNLYYGLRSSRLKKYYWLDLVLLSDNLLTTEQRLVQVRYFTSNIVSNGRNEPDRRRQSSYIDALRTRGGLSIHFGKFLRKDGHCLRCNSTWDSYEEKMSDVNIATHLLVDAFDDKYDTAILVSGDSDLSTPVREVLHRWPERRIIIAFPPKRHSNELKRAASGHLTIGANKLRQSQLPESVEVAPGKLLGRPRSWR